jgi:hypothetical protein
VSKIGRRLGRICTPRATANFREFIFFLGTWVNKGERMRCGENTGRDEGSVPIMGTTQCRQAGGGR